MQNKKYGFTLAEVLLTLLIIGIIMAMSVPVVVSVKNSYTKSTYHVYKSLEAAVTKIMSGSPHPTIIGFNDDKKPVFSRDFDTTDIRRYDVNNNMPNLLFSCSVNEDDPATLLHLIKGVEIDYNGQTCAEMQTASSAQSPLFCEALASLSNTGKKTVHCVDLELNDLKLKPIDGANTDEPRIESTALRQIYNKTAKPNFISNNGYWYYVSKWAKRSADDPYGYRLVAVDLNGHRLPNITDPDKGKFPDIVTFIVWDTGAIYPVGAAADDYFSADGRHRTLYLPSDAKGYQYTQCTEPGCKDSVPRECDIYGSGEKWVGKNAPSDCSYQVLNIENSVVPHNNGNYSKFTFREAYCTAYYQRELWDGNIAYHPDSFNYCFGTDEYGNPRVNFQADFLAGGYQECPEKGGIKTGRYDRCKVEPVKPAFKFKLEY